MVAEAAYDACLRVARQHYENFPVASRLMPPACRPHIAAIYAFARMADDVADEGTGSGASRLARLQHLRDRLHAAAAGQPQPDDAGDPDVSQIFTALSATMTIHRLNVGLFEDLLSAFQQDVVTTRYESWGKLLDYCRRSANPIGRLVLAVTGYRDDELDRRSDAVCTALQLTNFWQDLERDWLKGRLYLPLEILRAAGADERDLDSRRLTPAWRTALHEVSNRTRRLFVDGRPVADGVKGRLKWELRATWLGGMRILDRLEATDFDVFRRRPTLGVVDAAAIVGRVLVWR